MTSVAAFAVLVAFTGCSRSTDMFDQGAIDERDRQEQERIDEQRETIVNQNYAAAFERAFGKVGANVDWGFGRQPSTSRALTRSVGTYKDYRGHTATKDDLNFPEDCDADMFTPDLEAMGILSYEDYLISKGTQYWHPEEINDGGVVYIDAVQPIKISGGTEDAHAKLYIKAGTYDFTDVSFDLNINTDLYLLDGATVTFDNTVASSVIFDIYIAPGAQLIANGEDGLVADAGHIYNHGTITCTDFTATSTGGFLYNVGTLTTGTVNPTSSTSRIVNDGFINCSEVIVDAAAVQNNYEWNVSGTTHINSPNTGWVNNGHWKTHDYAYVGGSWNVVNNCFLEVENDFAMNISSENGAFKIDGNGGVLTKYFDGGRSETGAVAGPFVIIMGPKAVFKVEETAIMESSRGDENGFGIFGPTGTEDEYAVFQAKNIARDPYLESINSHGAVTYGGHLYVSAETHFAQGMDSDGSGNYVPQPYIYAKDGFSIENNIYAAGFKSGKPNITIPQTPCNPGFQGGDPLYRVIAEDLSAEQDGDFDFNDVVFDVVKAESGKTTLKLICAGGVLPLRVMGQEVHALFGDTTPELEKHPMYNTGAGPDKDPVIFEVDGTYTTPAQIKNIKIEVYKNDQWMELTATTGKAACKILVDDTFKIAGERENIADENENFYKYVQGTWSEDGFWWKSNQ